MLISAFIDDVYALDKGISAGHIRQLHVSASRLSDWLRRDSTIPDLTEANVSRFLLWLEGLGRKPRYLKKVKGDLLAIWRYAVEVGLLPDDPKRVRKITCNREVPRAWNLLELAALIEAARKLEGCYRNGIPRALFWECLIRLGYESGFRKADLLEIRFDEIQASDHGAIVCHMQSKTGVGQLAAIGPDTVAAIEAIRKPRRDIVLDWPYHEWTFRYQINRLTAAAGIKGTSKFLRRSCASYGARDGGEETAMKLLGHQTPGLARAHYIDPRIASFVRPALPRIPV